MKKTKEIFLNYVKIKNFKIFYGESKAVLSKGVNWVVGENGGGKTSLLEAILWCLGKDSLLSYRDDICNRSAIGEMGLNEPIETQVEVSISFRNDEIILDRICKCFKKNKDSIVYSEEDRSIFINGKKSVYPDIISNYIFNDSREILWYLNLGASTKELFNNMRLSKKDITRILGYANKLISDMEVKHNNSFSSSYEGENFVVFDGGEIAALSESENFWIKFCIWYGLFRCTSKDFVEMAPVLMDECRFSCVDMQPEILTTIIKDLHQAIICVTERDLESITNKANVISIKMNKLEKATIITK